MDEGREPDQVMVSPSILPPERQDLSVYSIRNEAGELVFATSDLVEMCLFVGSKSEH